MEEQFDILVKSFIESGIGKGWSWALAMLIIGLEIGIIIALSILVYILLNKLLHRVFGHLKAKQGNRIHIEFLERVTTFALAAFFIITLVGWKNIGGSLLGSAAVITAVIGFAAQDVIKDILSGMLICIYKPFDLGDRIELEDGTVGIVESITMRHVVIIRIDTLRMVIPNSKINAASILNYSFGDVQRSCLFKFPVGYDSDIEKTKKIIADAVKRSPYSIPGKPERGGEAGYGDVYFLDIADSALIMAVTVYYESHTASEKLKDDINTRVFEALVKDGIEIPYNYTSVVVKEQEAAG